MRPLGAGARLAVAAHLAGAWFAVTVLLAASAPAAAHPTAARSSAGQAIGITTTCPGPGCPYVPATADEAGIATDVLARINLERAAPARDYSYQGGQAALMPLAPAPAAAQDAAQAAAEWQATHGFVADYRGPVPTGTRYTTGGNAAGAGDSAGIDDAIMHSYGHALGELSAAPTQVAIGAACTSAGTLYVTEDFYDPNRAAWSQGQVRLAAELAHDSVYAESGGTVTTVTDGSGSGPAQDYLPQQPIVAGYGTNFSDLYATGSDWTCSGARFPPGSSPSSPLPVPVVAIASSADGHGYLLADAAGAVDVHGDAAFHGDLAAAPPSAPIVDVAPTADGGGYWMVGADGGVFAFGDAGFMGSLPGVGVHVDDIVGIAAPPSRAGYWLAGRDGGVFALDVPFYGAA